MGDNPTQSPGQSAATAEEKAVDGHYELNLDEHAPADIDAAFKDAVAAVDRAKDTDTGSVQTPASRADESVSAPPGQVEEPVANGSVTSTEPTSTSSAQGAETDGLRERLMRTLADFDNFRKRTERDKQSLRRFANFDVFKDFLGVLDNLERAMESSGSAEDLKQGLRMIVRQHEEILKRHGVQKVEAVGKTFDPKIHEAVAREESTKVDSPTVTQEMQKGYLLHDRLLRPAMVYVAMPGSKAASQSAAPKDKTHDRANDDGEASD